MFSAENLFKQIVYFGSYNRLVCNYRMLLKRAEMQTHDYQTLNYILNTIILIQQTLKNEPINYLDFCTQFRGRVIGDPAAKNLPEMNFKEMLSESKNSEFCYFESFHHALRENPRIDIIQKFQGCQILALRFFADKKRTFISLSNGLLVLYNTEKNIVLKVIP